MKKSLLIIVLSIFYVCVHAQCPEKPNAGPDRITCKKDTIVLGAYNSSYYWTSWGYGNLVQNHDNLTVFVPWITTIEGGPILFVLHAERPNSCPPQTDTLLITFKDSVVSVNAGMDLELCRSSAFVDIKGSATNADKFYWTKTVQGYQYNPLPPLNSDPNTLSPKYYFTDLDKYSGDPYHDMPFLPGDVQFILTGINTQSGCTDVDYSYVTFSKGPIVSIDKILPTCSSTKHLKGHSNGKFFKWTTAGKGTFKYGSDSLTVDYRSSVEDSISGSTTIYLQASDECGLKRSDSLKIKFNNTAIYGNVLAGTEILNNYKVTHFNFINKSNVVASTFQTSVPKYTVNLTAGSYNSLILISSENYENIRYSYLPTYFKTGSTWEGATPIKITDACTDTPVEANVQLIKAPVSTNKTWNTGSDFLFGTVTLADPSKPTSSPSVLPYAIVYLYDNVGNYLTYDITNEYGNYDFNVLKAGTYKVVTEYPGTKSVSSTIIIDGDRETGEVKNLEPKKVDVLTATTSFHSYVNSYFLLYPQPAGEELNLHLNGMNSSSIHISISDYTGHLKKEWTIGEASNNDKINIADLEDGFYIIKVSNGKESFQKGFVKVE